MRRVRPSFERATHAVALALSLLALGLSLRESALFLPLLMAALGALATPFVEWTSVPASLRAVLPRAHGLVLVTVGLLAWLSRSLSLVLLEPASLSLVAALLLIPMWAAFALAPRAFPAGKTLLPGVVAALVFAGLNPAPEGYGASLLPFPRDGSRNGFAEVYLVLALLMLVALWVGALGTSGPRWSRRTLVAVAVTLAVSAGLGASAIVGLPLAQPHVERAFAAALDQGATGLSGKSTLGEIGELSLSRRRVLDLETLPFDGGSWLLPSEVFTRFDGRTWSNDPRPREARIVDETALRPGAPPDVVDPLLAGLGRWFPVHQDERGEPAGAPLRVTQAERARWPLLVPRHPAAVTANASVLGRDRFGLIRRPHGLPLRQYGVVLAGESASQVAGELSAAEREESLSLPETVDPRLVALAGELASSVSDPGGRVDATVRHLQTHYRYSLSPGPFRAGGDPLAEFLFEKKEAYCDYFAIDAVFLLLMQAVPARFAKGLSVGPQNDMGGGLYVVRESDAHAWVEAWIPGEGWVEADPTPPGQFAAARGAPAAADRWLQRVRAGVTRAWARLLEGGLVAFLRWLGGAIAALVGRALREPVFDLVVALLLVLPVAWRGVRRALRQQRHARERDQAHHVPADLRALVRDLERRWKARGRPRPPSRGLLEHARAVAEPPRDGSAALPAPLVAAGEAIVDAYYVSRFGEGRPPRPEELARLHAALGKD